MPRNQLINLRKDTAADWTSVDPILYNGEPGYETNTGKVKIGDGINHWSVLPYLTDAAVATETTRAMAAEAKTVPRWAPTTVYTLGQQVVSPNNDVVSAIAAHTSGAGFAPANWSGSSTFARPFGERLRRAAAAAKGKNSVELPVMTAPPTITTGTTDLDSTLTNRPYFTVSAANAACYRFRGGIPQIGGSVYYQFPTVTQPATAGNVDATHTAVGWAVEFFSDAPKVELFMLNSTSTNGVMVEVDGVAVASAPTAFPASSGGSYFLLDFTTAGGAATRQFRVEGDRASGMRGVHVGPTYTVWAPTDPEPLTVASVGDSVSAQTGVTSPDGGWNINLGKLLGWSDVRQIGLGGTGWINPGGFASTFADATRIADTVAVAPDLVLITGSTNDSASTPAAITAAVLTGLQAYRTALPLTPIILGGVWPGATGPSAATLANENAVAAAFTAWADSNSWFVPISTDPAQSWVTGTGHVGATTGTGNADRYIGASDTTHPGQPGHLYYARRWAAALRKSVLPYVK